MKTITHVTESHKAVFYYNEDDKIVKIEYYGRDDDLNEDIHLTTEIYSYNAQGTLIRVSEIDEIDGEVINVDVEDEIIGTPEMTKKLYEDKERDFMTGTIEGGMIEHE